MSLLQSTEPIAVPEASVCNINSFEKSGYVKMGGEKRAFFRKMNEFSHCSVHSNLVFTYIVYLNNWLFLQNVL